MINNHLPKKLNKEPLLQALFEIRFTANTSASTVLPGLLFSKLEGDKVTEQLSTAQIPIEIRSQDPNLQFVPISRLIWNNFHINIGDKNLSIGSPSSYLGWENFKKSILQIIEILDASDIIQSVERYSLKYINLIPFSDNKKPISLINIDIYIAEKQVANEFFQLTIERNKDSLINIINIISSAKTPLAGGSFKHGIIIDIDTIAIIDSPINKVIENLEKTRQINKQTFFELLTEETLNFLEPVYD